MFDRLAENGGGNSAFGNGQNRLFLVRGKRGLKARLGIYASGLGVRASGRGNRRDGENVQFLFALSGSIRLVVG